MQHSLCSTGVPHTQGAQAWITQFYLQLVVVYNNLLVTLVTQKIVVDRPL